MKSDRHALVHFDGGAFDVFAAGKVNELLQRLARTESRSGDLTIGLGAGDCSVALFLDSEARPFHAFAGPPSSAGDPVTFEMNGTHFEFGRKCVISLDQAIDAVAVFEEFCERTQELEWRAEGAVTAS